MNIEPVKNSSKTTPKKNEPNVQADPAFEKAYAHRQSNAVNAQLTHLERAIQTNYDAKLYRIVVLHLDRAIKLSPVCCRYRVLKAECLAYLGCYDEAVNIAISVMKFDSTSADAFYVRGLCFYYTDNLEEGISHFELALKLNPDHKKAKEMLNKTKSFKDMKENGNVLFKSGRYREALAVYTAALKIDEFNKHINSEMLYLRALVRSKINNIRDAVADCTRVLQINDKYLKALLLRALCYNHLEKFDDCCNDYETALQIQKSPEIEKMLRDAKLALEELKNKQKNEQQLTQLEQTIKSNYDAKLYSNVVSDLEKAIKLSPACTRYRLLKAECLAYLGCCDEAVDIAMCVMKLDSTSADAIYVRGLCFYYADNLEEGINHFELVLELDPDHKKAKEMRYKSKTLKDMNENGKVLFKSGRYHEALVCYTDALTIDEFNKTINSKLLTNRALVHSKMNNLRDAVEDCTRVLQINDKYLKALLLRARCYKDLAKFEDSCKDYESALKIQNTPDIENMFRDAVNAQKQVEQLRQLEQTINTNYETKLYRNVVNNLDIAIKLSPECYKYRLLKAECLAYLGCYDEAVEIVISVMKLDSTLADAFYVRGLCFCYTGNLEEGISHFKLALQLDPDHKKAKEMHYKNKTLKDMKENGNVLFKSGSYREALACYTDALKIDEFNKNINSKLLYNCAVVHLKINNLRDAVEDCTRVLQINDKYLKALVLRARCYNDLEKFDDSCKDYEAALQIQNTPDIEQMLRDAKLALEQSKTKNYYTILGVTRNAGEAEIKKAYRIKALMHHPDRHVNSSPEKQKEQESKFKEIGKAYEILSDQGKKMYYDRKTFGQANHPC